MKKIFVLALAIACLLMLPVYAEDDSAIQSEYVYVDLLSEGSVTGSYSVPNDFAFFAGETVKDRLYSLILTSLENMSQSIDISALGLTNNDANTELISDVYEAVVNDHPRLFYVTGGYTRHYYPDGNNVLITPDYDDLSNVTTRKAELETKINEIMALISNDMSDLEKILVVHDYLVENVAYNWAVATGNNAAADQYVWDAYGTLVKGDAVCQGYTVAYKIFLDEFEIENTYANSDAMNHIWNVVKLDGYWYHIDVTWDDPTPNLVGSVGYSNFLRSDIGIAEAGHHGWDTAKTPACESAAYESGYIFNGAESHLYTDGGYFYYVTTEKEKQTIGGMEYTFTNYCVYKTQSLNVAGTKLCEKLSMGTPRGSYYPPGAFVWQDGKLYYPVNTLISIEGKENYTIGYINLMVYDYTKNTNSGTELASFEFNRTASSDGKYGERSDSVGIYYDPVDDAVKIVTANHPGTVRYTYKIPDYPVEWDQASTSVTSILGVETKTDVLQIGVVGAETVRGTLCAAFYIDGRMKAIHTFELTQQGLNVLELARESIPADAVMKLFLIDAETVAPLCAAYPNN